MEYYAYFLSLGTFICLYLMLAQSFNLTFGLGMLFNLAHVAVYAIGAYTAALLSTELGAGFFLCAAASMIVGGFFALVIGGISLKLSAEYFAIGTLAFSSVVTAILVNWRSLTRGVLGINNIPRPIVFGIDCSSDEHFFLLIFAATVFTLLIHWAIFRGPLARSLKAQAEHEAASESLGKNSRYVRNAAFIISSMFAGLAGAFYAYYINFIVPSSFDLKEMIFVFSIVIVGKPGSFWGVIAGTIFLVLLPEGLRFLELPHGVEGPLRQMLYALVLFGVVYWKRDTLFPIQRSV